ncbi:NAD-binding protein [Flagelloscypha sp. PMI_526]|nr:NAD-binding protein [Flagelloscypha sp. PMI_526]
MVGFLYNFTLIRDFIAVTWPPKSTFEPTRDIPDLTGKVFVITGANSGCGYYTAKAILGKNGKVYFACRDETKARKAMEELEEATKTTGKGLAHFLKVDLASLKSVKAGAEDFLKREARLDTLFNNAGVMWCPIELTTEDGYDLQFGCNVVGHFYLTQLLLPALLEAAKADKQSGRVINTSSMGHQLVKGPLDYEVLKDVPKRKKQSTESMYYASKFGNVLFAKELHRRYHNEGIISASLNPGNIVTNLQRYTDDITRYILQRFFCHPTPLGALTQLYMGTIAEASDVSGNYFVPWARQGTALPLAEDPHEAETLWNWLEDEIKSKTNA